MAGYFTHPYKISGGGYWNRLKKLLMPYIIWTIFYSVSSSANGFNPLQIVYHLITGRAQAQLYYIVVLVELTLLIPLLMRVLDNRKLSAVILSLTPIYLILCTGYRYYTGAELSWLGRDFCAWIIFYYLGMIVKRYGWKQRKHIFLWTAYIITLAFSVLEGIIADGLGMFSLAISQVKISSMTYSLTVIALILNYWPSSKKKSLYQETYRTKQGKLGSFNIQFKYLLVYIGDISFGIYFCHTFVLRCVSFVLRHIGVIELFPLPLIQLLQFSLTLLCCMIGIYIIQHIDVKRKFCPYIGL